MKSGPSYMVLIAFTKHGPIGDIQKCLKRTFEEKLMKSDSSIVVCRVY